MNISLTDTIVAGIVSGRQIRWMPKWDLGDHSIMVAPYENGDAHERHFLQTVGSGNWYRSEFDEFRFGKNDLALKSVWFRVPERNLPWSASIDKWKNSELIVGSLCLSSVEPFQIEPTEFRWMEPEGTMLICLTTEGLEAAGNRLRLRIADNIELLFVKGRRCGWILSNPVRHLVFAWQNPRFTEPLSKELPKLVHKYLELVSEDNIDEMENGDVRVLTQLHQLHSSVKRIADGSLQNSVVLKSIEDIVMHFYGENLVGK